MAILGGKFKFCNKCYITNLLTYRYNVSRKQLITGHLYPLTTPEDLYRTDNKTQYQSTLCM